MSQTSREHELVRRAHAAGISDDAIHRFQTTFREIAEQKAKGRRTKLVSGALGAMGAAGVGLTPPTEHSTPTDYIAFLGASGLLAGSALANYMGQKKEMTARKAQDTLLDAFERDIRTREGMNEPVTIEMNPLIPRPRIRPPPAPEGHVPPTSAVRPPLSVRRITPASEPRPSHVLNGLRLNNPRTQ